MASISPTENFNQNSNIGMIEVPKKYSINLLWINKKLPKKEDDFSCNPSFFEEVLDNAYNWKLQNPKAIVNIWYDSRITHSESIDLLNEKLCKKNIALLDINSINIVSVNPDLLGTHMPLYYRIDLLKLIICGHEIKNNQSAIFVDGKKNGIKPIPKEILFNDKFRHNFTQIGFACNKGENQFLQLIDDKKTIKSVAFVINLNLFRAAHLLNEKIKDKKELENRLDTLHGMVYHGTIEDIRNHYYGINTKQLTKVKLPGKKKFEHYDPAKHGYEVFGVTTKTISKEATYLGADGNPVTKNLSNYYDVRREEFDDGSLFDGWREDIKRTGTSHKDSVCLDVPPPKNKSESYSWVSWEEAMK